MNTTFRVVLEHHCADAAHEYLRLGKYVNGDHAMTERGKAKHKEEYTPVYNEARERLLELLDLNYPEFSGRFMRVSSYANGTFTFISVRRKGATDPENPFAE